MKVTREILLTLDIEYRPIKERGQILTDPSNDKSYAIIKVEHNGVELDLSTQDEEAIIQELIDDEPESPEDDEKDGGRDDEEAMVF